MRIIYIADDGTEFNDEWECEMYEKALEYPAIKNIIFYDRNDNPYSIGDDLFDDAVYNECEKVLIHDNDEYDALQWLANECGYCEFEESISSPGFWVRHINKSPIAEATWELVK